MQLIIIDVKYGSILNGSSIAVHLIFLWSVFIFTIVSSSLEVAGYCIKHSPVAPIFLLNGTATEASVQFQINTVLGIISQHYLHFVSVSWLADRLLYFMWTTVPKWECQTRLKIISWSWRGHIVKDEAIL